jgi:hypothetical protein
VYVDGRGQQLGPPETEGAHSSTGSRRPSSRSSNAAGARRSSSGRRGPPADAPSDERAVNRSEPVLRSNRCSGPRT